MFPVSPGDGSTEFAFDVTIPSFEVVKLSLWLSSTLGIGMSTKHTASLIPFDVCASLIFSVLATKLGASTEIDLNFVRSVETIEIDGVDWGKELGRGSIFTCIDYH